MSLCSKCKKECDQSRCDDCKEKDKRYRELQKKLKEAIERCRGRNRYGNPCDNHKVKETHFCNFHDYMIDYTPEMLENLTLCSGCKMMKYLPNQSRCEICVQRGKLTNEDVKVNRNKIQRCIHIKNKTAEQCIFKRSAENEYCLKHQTYYFKQETEKLGKKVCSKYERGCRKQLNINDKQTCDECLAEARQYDKTLYNKKMEQPVPEGSTRCVNCTHIRTNDMFIGIRGQIVDQCDYCRKLQVKYDSTDNRKARDRWEDEQKPEIKATRKIYRDNHKLENKISSIHNRANQYMYNWKDYHEKKAKNARDWREKNPDKTKQYYREGKIDNDTLIRGFKKAVKQRIITNDLTDDELINYFNDICFYCGDSPTESNKNGVDRLDSYKHYTVDNCVTACSVCNFMKHCLDPGVFICRVEHILTNNNIIDGFLDYNLIPDHKHVLYTSYKNRAEKKNIVFELDYNTFDDLKNTKCYICGKEPNENHVSGIDRYDSNIGYTVENCKPCCTECNIMKNNTDYPDFIKQCRKIYSCCFINGDLTEKINNKLKQYYSSMNIKDTNDDINCDTLHLITQNTECNKQTLTNMNRPKLSKDGKLVISEQIKNDRKTKTLLNNSHENIKKKIDILHQQK
jgi:hypothetical protein